MNSGVQVFGLFPIPNTIAPWAALLLFQLIPHVSFLGHLSGMATGYAFVGGCMHRLMFTAKRIKTLRAKCTLLILFIRWGGSDGFLLKSTPQSCLSPRFPLSLPSFRAIHPLLRLQPVYCSHHVRAASIPVYGRTGHG